MVAEEKEAEVHEQRVEEMIVGGFVVGQADDQWFRGEPQEGGRLVEPHRLEEERHADGYRQRDDSRPETFLMHYPHAPHRTHYFTCYRDGDWKVIYHYFPTDVSGCSHYQLFNLAEDPFEQTDLAASRPDQLRRVMQDLIAALEQHDAVYPVNKDGHVQKPKLP